jgi:hypothetical protein
VRVTRGGSAEVRVRARIRRDTEAGGGHAHFLRREPCVLVQHDGHQVVAAEVGRVNVAQVELDARDGPPFPLPLPPSTYDMLDHHGVAIVARHLQRRQPTQMWHRRRNRREARLARE